MSMFNLFLILFSIVLGYLLGFVFIFHVIKTGKVPDLNKKKKRKGKKKRQNVKKKKKSLDNRFTDQGENYSELVCSVEGVEEAQYVKESRKKQNDAYSYTGRKELIKDGND